MHPNIFKYVVIEQCKNSVTHTCVQLVVARGNYKCVNYSALYIVYDLGASSNKQLSARCVGHSINAIRTRKYELRVFVIANIAQEPFVGVMRLETNSNF